MKLGIQVTPINWFHGFQGTHHFQELHKKLVIENPMKSQIHNLSKNPSPEIRALVYLLRLVLLCLYPYDQGPCSKNPV